MGSYTGDHNAKKSRLGTASNEITGGGGGGASTSTSLRSTNPRP